MVAKPLIWLGSALDLLRAFPSESRRDAGYQLRRLQTSLMPSDWKPLPTVGPGAHEMRVHTTREHRVVYVARFAEAVYVLHAFEKRTQRTRQGDIELARTRLAELQLLRRQRKEG